MGNWHNVLRAINMASCWSLHSPPPPFFFLSFFFFFLPFLFSMISLESSLINIAAKLPKPQLDGEDRDAALPQTLVRIPTEHAPALQAQADAAEEE